MHSVLESLGHLNFETPDAFERLVLRLLESLGTPNLEAPCESHARLASSQQNTREPAIMIVGLQFDVELQTHNRSANSLCYSF